jgi:hypothetical protein
MNLTDIHELKAILEITASDTSEDVRLNFYIEWATALIKEYLNRPLAYETRTEFYSGTGTQKLLLRARPVVVTGLEVRVDNAGYYGAPDDSFGSGSVLTFGDDYFLELDQSDGTSRSGILVRRSAVWERPFVRFRGLLSPLVGEAFGNVKVTYTGGWKPETIPPEVRQACCMLVAKLRYLYPLGVNLVSEHYEERHITIGSRSRNYLLSEVASLIRTHRNYKF